MNECFPRHMHAYICILCIVTSCHGVAGISNLTYLQVLLYDTKERT